MEKVLATFAAGGKSGVIRQYRPSDHAQIKRLWQSTGQFDGEWDSKTSLNLMIKQRPYAILVAEVDRQIAGTVGLQTLGRRAKLFRFNVRKNVRGKGLDLTLLRTAEEILKRQGIKKVRLSFLDGNPRLAKYYQRRGWVIHPTLRLFATKEL